MEFVTTAKRQNTSIAERARIPILCKTEHGIAKSGKQRFRLSHKLQVAIDTQFTVTWGK
jgi:hypothetical protein